MLITLEHNGTKEHIDASNELKNYIEEEIGATVEIVSGHYGSEIYGYDEENRQIFSVDLPLTKFDFGNVAYILNVMTN